MNQPTRKGWRSWRPPNWMRTMAAGLALTLLGTVDVSAQCLNSTAFGTYTSNNSGAVQTLSTCHYLTEYSTVNGVIPGATYELTITSSGGPGYITVREGTPGGPVLAHGPSPLNFTNGAGTTFYPHWTIDAACATTTGCEVGTILYFPFDCAPPATPSVVNITGTSADVSFTPTGNMMYVEYGTPGFTPGENSAAVGGTVVSSMTSPIAIAGLTGGTTYEVYMREDCGLGAVWANAQTAFNTSCPGSIPLPYSENVNTAVPPALPPCVANIDDGNGPTWVTAAAPAGFTGNVIKIDGDATFAQDDWFFARGISGVSLGTSVTIQWVEGNAGATASSYEVTVGTSPSATLNVIGTFSVATGGGVATTQTIDYVNLLAGDLYFGFHATGGINAPTLYIDDLFIDVTPTCDQPDQPSISNITGTTADVNITCAGCLGTYEVQVGAPGFTAGTGTSFFGPGPAITITGLTGLTDYDVYVRQDCGAGGTSFWTAVESFTTGCTAFSIPYFEDFSTYTDNTVPVCYDRFDGGTFGGIYAWAVDDFLTGVGYGSGGKHLEIYGNQAPEDWIFLPLMTFAGGTTYQLSFYKGSSTTATYNNNIEIAYGSAQTVADMTNPIDAFTQTSGSTAGEFYYVNFTPVASGDYSIGIKMEGAASQFQYIQIDDISVDVAPACSAIDFGSLGVSNIGTASADVVWNCTGCAGSFGVIYGPAGFDPATAGTTVTSAGSPASLSGLTDNTAYDAYVYQDCGGSQSDTIGIASFTTLCLPATVPYFEDYTSFPDNVTPDCYTVFDGGSNTTGGIYNWATDAFLAGVGYGSGAMHMEIYSNQTGYDFFWMQELNLVGGTSYRIQYFLGQSNTSASNQNMLEVSYNSSPDSAGRTIVTDFMLPTGSTNGNFYVHDFTPAVTGVYSIGFGAHRSATNTAYYQLDDLEVVETPSCEPVLSVTTAPFGTDSVLVDWNCAGCVGPYIVEYGPIGFTPGSDVTAGVGGTIITATGDSAFIDLATIPVFCANLQVYVRQNCGPGDLSVNAGPGVFGTLQGTSVAPYLETMDGADNNAQIPNICWSQTSTDPWTIAPSGDTGPGYGVAGSVDHTSGSGNFMWIDGSGAAPGILANSLETGDIDFSGLSNPYAGFWLLMNNIDNAIRNHVTLSYWDGAAWVQILDQASPQNPNWVQVGACVPASAPNPTRFRIVGLPDLVNTGSQFNNDILIDDFFVDEAPCLAPVASTAGIAATSTNISWDDNCALGTYSLEWGPAGFTPGSGGTVVSPATPAVAITGLTELTAYDAYVWQECGPGTNSDTTLVSWTTAADCTPVTALSADNVVSTSAVINWTCFACTGTFSVEYGVAPLTPGSGTVIDPATAGTALTGLTSNTSYDVLVWQTCGAGPANGDTVSVSFTTLPGCGDQFLDNGGAGPYLPNSDEVTTFCPENPGELLTITFTSYQSETNWDGLFVFDGPDTNLVNSPLFPGIPGTYSGNLAAFAGPSGIHKGDAFRGTLTGANLPGPFTSSHPSGCLTFHFVNDGSVNQAGWVSDIECITCEAPSALAVSNIASDAADVSWTCNTLCSGTFSLEYGPTGFAPGSGTVFTPASSPLSLTGLTPATGYDVYIWQDCGVDGFSDTSFVAFTTADACPSVTALSSAATSGSDVDVSWACAGCTGTFVIEYGPAGFAQGSGTFVNPATSPQTISGLMDQTAYDFYVWQDCGMGAASDTLLTSATTPCLTFVAPYVQNFDSWAQGATACSSPYTAGPCWENSLTDDGVDWLGDLNGTGSTGTGPSGDHTSGSGVYLYRETSGCAGQTAEIISPIVDVSALTAPQLTFWYHMLGATMGTMEVFISTDGGATYPAIPAWSLSGNQSNLWTEQIIPLPITSSLRVKWAGTAGTSYTSDMAIDDVVIADPPSCFPVSALASANETQTSADISWSCAGCTGNYFVEVGPVGFTPGNDATAGGGTVFAAGSSTSTTITGLSASSVYDVYVRQDCGGTNGFSLNAGPLVVETLCGTVVAPYAMNFDSWAQTASTACGAAYSAEACWENLITDPTDWLADAAGTGSTGTGPGTDHTTGTAAGKYMYKETSGCAGQIGDLHTPTVDVTGLTVPAMSFWYHMWGAAMGTLEVYISDDGGVTFPAAPAWSLSGDQGNSWKEAIIVLPSDNDIVVKFRGINGTTFTSDMAIDDVSFEEGPTCPNPAAFGPSNITNGGADVSWTCVGCAGTENIEWGPAGFAIGSGTLVSPASSPETISGLATGTTYDVYLWVDCGPGDQSDTLFTSFTTLPGCGDNWYDNGGPTSAYQPGSDEITTFCPDVPGESVVMSFNSFQTENNWDGLFVFDGPTDDPLTAFPGIAGGLSGDLNIAANAYTPSILPYRGSTIPGPFVSSDPSGCLTFRFVSDGSVNQAGWNATISCIETNFTCATADTAFCGDFISGVVVGANSLPPTACDYNGGASTGGTWYAHLGTGDDMTASTCGLASFDSRISVFEATPDCSNMVCVGGSDDVTGCGSNTSEITFATTAGTWYYVAVHGVDGSQGAFTLDLVCTPACTPGAVGDDCASAAPITPVIKDGLGVPTMYDNTCAYVDGPVACSGALPVQGQFFTFNAGTGTFFDLTLNTNNEDAAMTATEMGYSLYAGTTCAGLGAGGTPIACSASAGGTTALPPLTPGADYTLHVWNEGGLGVQGTYGLLLEYAPDLDASVEAILAPIEWDFISSSICGSSFQPIILIKNNGTQDLTSVDITWDIDGGANGGPFSYTWTGFLTFGAQTGVALPITNTPFGVHALNISVSNPNGGVDEVPTNDAASVSYNAQGEAAKVHIVSDNFGAQTTWEIFDAFFLSAAAGGPYPNNVDVTEEVCLPTTFGSCYSFYVFDSFGDGMCCANGLGEWELYDTFDNLILRDSGIFATQSPSLTPEAPAYFAHEFCLPLGPSSIAASDCNVYTNDLKDRVYATFVPGASNYQFQFLDPDAGFRRFIAVGATRWVQFSTLTSNPTYPIVANRTYFARVRVDLGSPGFFDDNFGAGCDMMIDGAQVPGCTQLIDTPGPTFSCNVTRELDAGQKLWAQPVFGATGYQFRFENATEGYLRFLATPSYVLNLNTWAVLPLQVGSTYDVTVQLYLAGVPGGFCGAPCTVTILPPAPATSGLKDVASVETGVSLYPNPVRDGLVQLLLTDLVDEEQNITVDVYDLFGKHVMGAEYGNSGSVFNTVLELSSDMAAGTYTVQITVNDEVIIERLMVQ